MTFAGLSNPQDRANVIAFLNQHSDAPKPLPAAPRGDRNYRPGQARHRPQPDDRPVLTEQQAGKNPKNVGGEAAVNVAGPASAKKPKRALTRAGRSGWPAAAGSPHNSG